MVALFLLLIIIIIKEFCGAVGMQSTAEACQEVIIPQIFHNLSKSFL